MFMSSLSIIERQSHNNNVKLKAYNLVAEETGWGVVPSYPTGRLFRDRLGTLTRQIGAIAHATYLVTAGYALNLTDLGTRFD